MKIKFPINNRFTGEAIIEVEIECEADAPHSIKLGLAVRVAVKADAYLARANLARANLARAYLADATYAGFPCTQPPIQISGLFKNYLVTILDNAMAIGCEVHSLADWWGFDDAALGRMDGSKAVEAWRQNKAALFALAGAHGRWEMPEAERGEGVEQPALEDE